MPFLLAPIAGAAGLGGLGAGAAGAAAGAGGGLGAIGTILGAVTQLAGAFAGAGGSGGGTVQPPPPPPAAPEPEPTVEPEGVLDREAAKARSVQRQQEEALTPPSILSEIDEQANVVKKKLTGT